MEMSREELLNAIEGLHTYDEGGTDVGIKDDILKAELRARDDIEELALAFVVRIATTKGYVLEDVASFLRWCEDELHLFVW